MCDFTWERPWLTDDDCVWCYLGYGEFILLPQDDARVRLRLRMLQCPRLRESERKRLTTALGIKAAWERRAEVVAVIEEAIALLREGVYA